MTAIGRIRETIRRQGEWRWGRLAIAQWSWSIAAIKFGDDGHVALNVCCLWLRLWTARTPIRGEMLDKWGLTIFHRSVQLSWGHRCKFFHLPWMMDCCRTSTMLRDGNFVRFGKLLEPTDVYREVFPYTYTLRSGQIQNRLATVTVERRSWCWRGRPFRWLRWPGITTTSICVEFDDEVGERAGSWKGGVMGCGYELLPDESPEQCLRRMERERRFS